MENFAGPAKFSGGPVIFRDPKDRHLPDFEKIYRGLSRQWSEIPSRQNKHGS
jgi:hypothetical protein